jgi:hypothetical protein
MPRIENCHFFDVPKGRLPVKDLPSQKSLICIYLKSLAFALPGVGWPPTVGLDFTAPSHPVRLGHAGMRASAGDGSTENSRRSIHLHRGARRRTTPLSSQADVRSIEAIKEFRAALALYAEEAQGALGAVKMEARRTVQWLQHDRKTYWSEQVKRRREQVASARAEVARRRLAKTPEHTPAFSEQKEILRQAEAGLREAEMKVALIKKWEPALQLAVLELHASVRRIGDLSGTDVPRACFLLGRLIDALEAYLREAPPSGLAAPADAALASIATTIFDEEDATIAAEPAPDEPEPTPEDLGFNDPPA